MSRFIAATGILLAVTAALVGCTEEEEPKPQWTEESAYAAAEETFRAYWKVSLAGDRTTEATYVTGDMLEIYETNDDGQDITKEARGDASIQSFDGQEFRLVRDIAVVEALACIDASTYELRSEDGSWYQPREEPKYGVALRFSSVDSKMLVDDLKIDESATC